MMLFNVTKYLCLSIYRSWLLQIHLCPVDATACFTFVSTKPWLSSDSLSLYNIKIYSSASNLFREKTISMYSRLKLGLVREEGLVLKRLNTFLAFIYQWIFKNISINAWCMTLKVIKVIRSTFYLQINFFFDIFLVYHKICIKSSMQGHIGHF
jgi:hypothetical protein